MKKILLLVSLCILIPAFAEEITNAEPWDYHVCTTSNGGSTWDDVGTVNSNTHMDFDDGTADAIAVGKIGDCNYDGTSWTNHTADIQVLNWNGSPPSLGLAIHPNAAMIFWEGSSFTHVGTNNGLAPVCLYNSTVFPYDKGDCYF